MSDWTKDGFFKMMGKPKEEKDGIELMLTHYFDNNNSKSIFTVTGLDFSEMLK